MEKKNIHKDHRQRVRARYLKEGITSMEDHNIIELLLFFGIPYKDTNGIAHSLVEKFGDLNGVLEAPVEELMKIDGIGENAATLISLIHDISLIYDTRKKQKEFEKDESRSLMDSIKLKFADERKEKVYIFCVDAQGKMQRCVKICDGSPDTAVVDTRVIVETVVRFDAKNVILVHNHPNGFAVPSLADVRVTRELNLVLNAIGVNLADHVIVADDDAFSMAQNAKYKELFR